MVMIECLYKWSDGVADEEVTEEKGNGPSEDEGKHYVRSDTEALHGEYALVKQQNGGFCATKTDDRQQLARKFALSVESEMLG